MKKNKKKGLIVSISILVSLAIIGLIFLIVNSRDDNSLTLEENKWIESNKSYVIDVAILNDIPVLSYNGEGFVYNYLDYVKNNYALEFNFISYKLDSNVEYDYKMDIVSNVTENDIVLLEDNLVLVTKNNDVYTDIKDIDNIKIGIHSTDKDLLSNYFASANIEFVTYDSYSELKQTLNKIEQTTDTTTETSTTANSVDGIIIPKTIYIKELIENDYNISYHINDLNKYFVLTANGTKELNSILTKSYNIWKEENYEKNYNSSLLENYYKFNNITDRASASILPTNIQS